MRRHLVTKGSFYARLADHGHEIVVPRSSKISRAWVRSSPAALERREYRGTALARRGAVCHPHH
jgi:hypothetical protein